MWVLAGAANLGGEDDGEGAADGLLKRGCDGVKCLSFLDKRKKTSDLPNHASNSKFFSESLLTISQRAVTDDFAACISPRNAAILDAADLSRTSSTSQ